MREFLSRLLNSITGADYWVEITTNSPRCIYYFGPFETKGEADESIAGYVEDLSGEGAQGIDITVKRDRPTQLTIDEEGGVASDRLPFPVLSGQA